MDCDFCVFVGSVNTSLISSKKIPFVIPSRVLIVGFCTAFM